MGSESFEANDNCSKAVAGSAGASIRMAAEFGLDKNWKNVKVRCREVERTWLEWLTGKPRMWETVAAFELQPYASEPPEVK